VQPARGPGRPRDEATDARILQATLRLMARDGYKRMTLRAIAAEAAVSKATIYLRWRDKADLATAAIEFGPSAESPEPTGHTREDLLAHLRWFRAASARSSATGLVGACLMEEHHTPTLLRLLRERAVRPRWSLLRRILAHATEAGELRAGLDVDAMTDMVFGAYYAQYLRGAEADEELDEHVVDAILGMLGHGAREAR
jgi:AcrR family transcriptional regulator